MAASWWKRHGSSTADRRGLAVLLWKPFTEREWTGMEASGEATTGTSARAGGLGAGIARTFASLSRFHIVLVAAGGSLVFGWLLTGRFWPLVAAAVAVDWFLVNLVNRVVDVPEDRINHIRATEVAWRHRRALLGLAVGVYVASFAVHLFWLPALLPVRAAYHLLGVLYNFRLLPRLVRTQRRPTTRAPRGVSTPETEPAQRGGARPPAPLAATSGGAVSAAAATEPAPNASVSAGRPHHGGGPEIRSGSPHARRRASTERAGRLRDDRVRLKELLLFKNGASNLGFLITLFGYPLAALPLAPDATPTRIALLALAFATFEYSFEVIYDLRDVDGDRAAGVRTWPVVRGARWATALVVALNVVSVHVSLWGAAFGALGLREAVLAVGPAAQLALFLPAVRRGLLPRDCVRITWAFVGLLLGYCAWVLVGLPTALPGPLAPAVLVEVGLVGVVASLWWSLRHPGRSGPAPGDDRPAGGDRPALGDRGFLAAYVAIAVSAWAAEESAIVLYDFYRYDPSWTVFADTVPLAVALIWPLVVMSVWDLLRRAGLRGARLVALGGALVFAEALFVEIVGVHAGLWAWSGRGPFEVPLVGLAGWAAFGATALFALDRRGPWLLALPALGLAAVHAVVVLLWHLGLDRVSQVPVPDEVALAALVGLAGAAALATLRQRARLAIPLVAVPYRLLAAELLYACLALAASSAAPSAAGTPAVTTPVVAAALLFALPYLALFTWEARPRTGR